MAAGFIFEIGLVALASALPPDTWLAIKIHNFLILSHYPLLQVVAFFNILGLLLIPLAGVAMAYVWAFLFRRGWWLSNLALARLGLSKSAKLILASSAGIIAAAAAGFMVLDALNDRPVPFAASPKVKAVVEGNTAFALDLYQKLKTDPGNVFFSPYSISTALAMTWAGARGQTETDMAAAAHFNLPQDELHAAFGELAGRMNRIERSQDRITLVTANSLWRQQGHPFTPRFLDLIHSRYGARAETVDFRGNPQAASDRINGWVRKATRGKINSIGRPGMFKEQSLVLCSAIYFKGQWASKFKTKDTSPQPFHITDDNEVTVPMMEQKASFKIARADDFPVELLELPYYGGDVSMVILLPRDNLSDLEAALNPDRLGRWLATLDQSAPHTALVRLPRFKTKQEVNLVESLKSLGMQLADVIHSAMVEVNEAGTEAAAVTLVHVKTKSRADRFFVDHPFLFLIREKGSGSILFLGRIVDPTR